MYVLPLGPPKLDFGLGSVSRGGGDLLPNRISWVLVFRTPRIFLKKGFPKLIVFRNVQIFFKNGVSEVDCF